MFFSGFGKIFANAYRIAVEHKFLWGFGLLLVWGSSFTVNYSISDWQELKPETWLVSFSKLFESRPGLTTFLLAAGLVFVWLVIVVYFRAKTALIISVKRITDKQTVGFKSAFVRSKLFYKRLLGVSILLALVLLAGILILGLPVVYLLSLKLYFRALLLGLFAALIFLALSIMLGFVNVLAPMFVVFHDLKIGESVKAGFNLLFHSFWRLLVFGFLLFLITAFVFFLTLGAALLVISPFVLFSEFFYDIFGFAVWQSVVLIIVSFCFVFLQAILAVFQQTAWVLLFNEIVKPLKDQEKEPSLAPEAA